MARPTERKAGSGVAGRVSAGAMALVLLVAVLTLVIVGCGSSSSSDTKANETYANGVCTAIGTWEQQVKAIATDFSGGISKASLETKLTQVEDATKTLVTQVKAVPPPNTSQGQATKQQLDQLSADITTTTSAAKSAIDQLQGNASVEAVTATVAALAPQVKALVSSAQSAITSLKSVKGSLGSAFKSTDSCKSLSPSS